MAIRHRAGCLVHDCPWLSAQSRNRIRRARRMCSLTLEDQGGLIEALLSPEAWRRQGAELTGQGTNQLRERIDSRSGALALHTD